MSTVSSASASLWAHFLKDGVGRNDGAQPALPPLGPQDKNATTMRVLLHDTQMNLEKFSGHVETLIADVRETAQGLRTTSSLFEREHDKLTGDMIDLVNRSQTQVQTSLGSPAQSSALDAFVKTVELRLDGLDKRLDAIHSFNQTHSQALQTQARAIQSIQDQQNAILGAVTPLVPLLQTLLPQIISASDRSRSKAGIAQPSIDKRSSPFPPGGSAKKRQRTDSSLDIQEVSPPKKVALPAENDRMYAHKRAQSSSGRSDRSLFPNTSPEAVRLGDSSVPQAKPLNPATRLPFTPHRPLQERLPLTELAPQNSTPYSSRANILRNSASKIPLAFGRTSADHKLTETPNKLISPKLSTPSSKQLQELRTPRLGNQALMPPPDAILQRQPPMVANKRLGELATSTSRRINALSPRSALQPKLKEPIKEGKRFIPLVDTDDDEDSE
ncbi:basidiospore development protein [Coprinopsis sp. MPI-PUGE-AT-0042]|nr:basidiospore development protein [Coprinopsis sp. MPI-PUGE-AT-0042]